MSRTNDIVYTPVVSVAVEFELTRQLARVDNWVGQIDRPSRVELQLTSWTSLK